MRGLILRVDRVTAWPVCRPGSFFQSRPAGKAAHTILWFYDCRFSRFKRVKTRQQTVAVCDLEQSSDALRKADDGKSAIGSLAGCKYANHASEAGRIHVRHRANVDNHGMRRLLPGNLLKVEQRLERQRPGQFHDAGALGRVDEINFQFFGTAGDHPIHFTQRSAVKFMNVWLRRILLPPPEVEAE